MDSSNFDSRIILKLSDIFHLFQKVNFSHKIHLILIKILLDNQQKD